VVRAIVVVVVASDTRRVVQLGEGVVLR